MDPRLKALIEVRDLLKAEGWAPEEATDTLPDQTSAGKTARMLNPILVVISLAAISTCFILIGANHDLLGVNNSTLSVRFVRSADSYASVDPHVDHIFATIDGEWVWGVQKPTQISTSNDEKEIGVHQTSFKTRTIEMDARNLLQLWHQRPDGSAFLIGQSVVSMNHPGGVEFDIKINDIGNPNKQFVVGLNIDKSVKRKVVASERRVRD
jgi:hypothetical protein